MDRTVHVSTSTNNMERGTGKVEQQLVPVEVLDLLGDEVARAILTASRQEAMTAEELAAVCDVSTTTVYRRLNSLMAVGLMEKGNQVRPEATHTTCTTNMQAIEVSLNETGLEVTLTASDASSQPD